VIDPTRVSEELGGLPGLRRLAARAAARRMGLIADIVPNHLAADARNPWWQDVLRSGRASAHAPAFDIDWEAGGGKLLLPILARPYGDALAGGEIRLLRQDGASRVQAGGQLLPLTDPQADPAAHDPGQPEGRARLHALLENQHYRLAWWRCAAEQLNWRRFFEISELAGVRVEDKTVFEAMHALPLALYAEGLLDGLRVDHIDGLAEPGAYLRRLRAALLAAAPGREPYLVVEKILAPHEALDTRWPVEGSTGYDFMDEVASSTCCAPACAMAAACASTTSWALSACGSCPRAPRRPTAPICICRGPSSWRWLRWKPGATARGSSAKTWAPCRRALTPACARPASRA
jgi:(1->4)-alpha-D-glucan 1-alpha-D-glucosylmutase